MLMVAVPSSSCTIRVRVFFSRSAATCCGLPAWSRNRRSVNPSCLRSNVGRATPTGRLLGFTRSRLAIGVTVTLSSVMGDSNANSREVPVVALYKQSGVSVESWVEMSAQVPMRYETDPDSDRTTLYFGQDDDYVLVLNVKN